MNLGSEDFQLLFFMFLLFYELKINSTIQKRTMCKSKDFEYFYVLIHVFPFGDSMIQQFPDLPSHTFYFCSLL